MKCCWVVRQRKNGNWQLFFDCGHGEKEVKGACFKTEDRVKTVLKYGGIVFIHYPSQKSNFRKKYVKE